MSILFERYLALKKGKVAEAPTPNQATQGVPLEILEALYQEVLDRLNATGVQDPVWLDGLDFNSPAYSEVKDRLNQAWLACLQGRASLENFTEVLKHYGEMVLSSVKQKVEK